MLSGHSIPSHRGQMSTLLTQSLSSSEERPIIHSRSISLGPFLPFDFFFFFTVNSLLLIL